MVTPAKDNEIIVASLYLPIYHTLCKLGTTLSVTYANILSVSTHVILHISESMISESMGYFRVGINFASLADAEVGHIHRPICRRLPKVLPLPRWTEI